MGCMSSTEGAPEISGVFFIDVEMYGVIHEIRLPRSEELPLPYGTLAFIYDKNNVGEIRLAISPKWELGKTFKVHVLIEELDERKYLEELGYKTLPEDKPLEIV